MGVNRTTKSRALGAALREAREAAGLSLREFSAQLEMSPSGLSLWETGKRTPPATEVAKILTMLGVAGAKFEETIALTQNTEASSWLAVSLEEQRRHLAALLRFEREAKHITAVSPLIVTGLLQIPAYVEAIMTGGSVPADDVETRIAIRLGRAKILDHVALATVIGEAALRQQVGGPEVLTAQLRHLLDMSHNVDLRVIPYTAGWNPALEGPWSVIQFEDEPTVIHMENRRSGLFLHEEEDVAAYREATASATEAAMSPTQTRELIAAVINELESQE